MIICHRRHQKSMPLNKEEFILQQQSPPMRFAIYRAMTNLFSLNIISIIFASLCLCLMIHGQIGDLTATSINGLFINVNKILHSPLPPVVNDFLDQMKSMLQLLFSDKSEPVTRQIVNIENHPINLFRFILIALFALKGINNIVLWPLCYYMNIVQQTYTITNKRVMLSSGLLGMNQHITFHSNIMDVTLKPTLLSRLLGLTQVNIHIKCEKKNSWKIKIHDLFNESSTAIKPVQLVGLTEDQSNNILHLVIEQQRH